MAEVLDGMFKELLNYLTDIFSKELAKNIYEELKGRVLWLWEKAKEYVQKKKTTSEHVGFGSTTNYDSSSSGTDISGLKPSCDKFKANVVKTVRGQIDQNLERELLEKIDSFAEQLMTKAA